jgi:hypothetical protein
MIVMGVPSALLVSWHSGELGFSVMSWLLLVGIALACSYVWGVLMWRFVFSRRHQGAK